MEEIRKISGFGEIKLARYGKFFLKAVVDYCSQHKLVSKIIEKFPKR